MQAGKDSKSFDSLQLRTLTYSQILSCVGNYHVAISQPIARKTRSDLIIGDVRQAVVAQVNNRSEGDKDVTVVDVESRAS